MKVILIGLAVLMISVGAESSDANLSKKVKLAEALLESTGTDQAIRQTMDQMLEMEIRNNPALGPYKNVMMTFFEKHISFQAIKPELVEIYVSEFTERELIELNDFYSTPTGKKSIEMMPKMMRMGADLATARIQANIHELQAMIEAEATRIQTLQNVDN